jgi:CHAT domain/Kelch motif
MHEMACLDFDVLLQHSGEGSYQARLINSPAGQAHPVDFTVPFSALEMENFLLRMARGRGQVRRVETPDATAIKTFGGRLYNALFHDDLLSGLLSSLSEAAARGAGLRIRLRLSDCPELADLPWEFLYDRSHNRFLALTQRTPLVRYLELPDPPRPLIVTPPLQILAMISNPTDFPRLDVEHEWATLQEALAPLLQGGRVRVERLDTATLSALQRRLRHDDVHILHFIGHGGFDRQAQEGVLILEDPSGRGRRVSGQVLGVPLHNHDPLRLVVLNACEGARSDITDPFAGTAQALIQQDIPAVVAMQFEISDLAAITFARELYGAVADGYPLDAAVAEARVAIHNDGNAIEWATPVLYLRAADGRIFDLRAPPGPDFAVEPTRLDFPPVVKDAPSPKGSLHLRNLGRGDLAATASTTSSWLQVHTAGDTVTVVASTAYTGTLEGAVVIRGDGEMISIPVSLTVEDPPHLVAEPATVDLGTVQVHGPSPQRVVHISNTGGGALDARATSADPWLHLEQHGNDVLATIDTSTSGEQTGAITIAAGEAGTVRIPVRVRVEQPPRLVVEPTSIDFGDIEPGTRSPPRVIRLTNVGEGRLDVVVTTSATWLEAELRGDELLVRAAALPPGGYSGAVTVDTNGGRADISAILQVRPALLPPQTPAEVTPPPQQELGPVLQAGWRGRRGRWVIAAAVAGVAAIATVLVLLRGTGGSGGGGVEEATFGQTPSTTPAPAVQYTTWQQLPDLLVPLEAAGVAALDGEIWVVGGLSPEEPRLALREVQIYNPAQNTWRYGPELPEGLDHAAVTSDGERLYIVGGRTGPNTAKVPSAEVYVLDGPDDDQWDSLGIPLPAPRAGGAVAWDGSQLVFGGGYDVETGAIVSHSEVWELRDREWRSIGQLAQPRHDLAVATNAGMVWLVGGEDSGGDQDPPPPLAAMDLVENHEVKPLADIEQPVEDSAAVWLPGRGVCLFGGVITPDGGSEEKVTDAVTCLEPGSQLPPLDPPRAGAGVVLLEDTIYVVGGFGSDGSETRVDVLAPRPSASSP